MFRFKFFYYLHLYFMCLYYHEDLYIELLVRP